MKPTIGKTGLFLMTLIILLTAGQMNFPRAFTINDKIINPDPDSSKTGIENEAAEINLSPEKQIHSGIKTAGTVRSFYRAQQTAYGRVVPVGDLADDAGNFETARTQLEKSQDDLSVSQRNYERIKSLYEKKLASQQDYQAAKASYLSDKADLVSERTNLMSLKSKIAGQWGEGISGWIYKNSETLKGLLSFKSTLIEMSLPSGKTGAAVPKQITIISPLNKNKRISCRFVSAGRLVDSQFQTQALYYITSVRGLSGGANLKVFVPEGKNLSGFIIPSASVIWYMGKAWIYIQRSKSKFARIEIETDEPTGNGFFVPESKGIINPGDEVVTKGAELLLSEELMPVKKSFGGDEDDND